MEDVRPTLKYYNEQGDPLAYFRAKVEELKAEGKAKQEAHQHSPFKSNYGYEGFRKRLG